MLLIPVAGHAIWDQVEANRVAAYVRDLRQRGEPVDNTAELKPLSSAQEKEASRLYYAAAILAADALPPYGPLRTPAVAGTRRALAEDVRVLVAADPAHVAADPRFASISGYVSRATLALQAIDRAADLPFTRFSQERSQYSYLSADLATLAAVGSLRTDVMSLRGDPAAADALRSAVEVSRTQRGLTWVLAPGTGGALRLLLDRTTPDASALERLQLAYEGLDRDNGLADDLVRRRAAMLAALWPTTARPHFSQRLGSRNRGEWNAGSFRYAVVRPYVTHEFLGFMHDVDEEVRVARLPLPDAFNEARARHPSLQSAGTEDTWTAWLQRKTAIPIWQHDPRGFAWAEAVTRVARVAAVNRTAIAALAVERYRRAHGGAMPASLEALRPQYLAQVPVDPFSGSPLRYRAGPDGYWIYSVGADLSDDGGDIGEWRSDLVAYPHVATKDIGLHVTRNAA